MERLHLTRAKEEGLAQAIGLVMGRTDLFMELLGDWPFDVILNPNRYSLLNRSAGGRCADREKP